MWKWFIKWIGYLKPNANSKRKLNIDYTPIKIKLEYKYFLKESSMTEETYSEIKNIIEETS